MDARKVIYFLNVLRNETCGYDAELNRLYGAAIAEDDEVAQLSTYLSECAFYAGTGQTLSSKALRLIDTLRADPYSAVETLKEIQQMNEAIAGELTSCRTLLRSAEPFSGEITVLPKKDTHDYYEVLTQIANTATYLMLLYGGMEATRNLTWPANASLRECARVVNTEYLGRLMEIDRPAGSWVIRKSKLGGGMFYDGAIFLLEYESRQSVEVLTSTLHKEPFGTHAFLNVRAVETGELDVPYCWGVGNLVSASPLHTLEFLGKGVVTQLRAPSDYELTENVPAPLACLNLLADRRPFCVSPDDLVSAMNQWQMGHEIAVRKQRGQCLCCGGVVERGRRVCAAHLMRER